MTLNMAILENVLCVFEDHIYSVVIRCNVLYAYPSKKAYLVFRLIVSLLIFLTACFNNEKCVKIFHYNLSNDLNIYFCIFYCVF